MLASHKQGNGLAICADVRKSPGDDVGRIGDVKDGQAVVAAASHESQVIGDEHVTGLAEIGVDRSHDRDIAGVRDVKDDQVVRALRDHVGVRATDKDGSGPAEGSGDKAPGFDLPRTWIGDVKDGQAVVGSARHIGIVARYKDVGGPLQVGAGEIPKPDVLGIRDVKDGQSILGIWLGRSIRGDVGVLARNIDGKGVGQTLICGPERVRLAWVEQIKDNQAVVQLGGDIGPLARDKDVAGPGQIGSAVADIPDAVRVRNIENGQSIG